MKPVLKVYANNAVIIDVGTRLHRLVARLLDSHIDDVDSAVLEELEREVDRHRTTHANGNPFEEVESDR